MANPSAPYTPFQLPCVPTSVLMKPTPTGTGTATVNVTPAEWLKLELVPIIDSGKLPTGLVKSVETVIVVVPEPVTVVGLKLALAPVGNPLALKLIVPANPAEGTTVT